MRAEVLPQCLQVKVMVFTCVESQGRGIQDHTHVDDLQSPHTHVQMHQEPEHTCVGDASLHTILVGDTYIIGAHTIKPSLPSGR